MCEREHQQLLELEDAENQVFLAGKLSARPVYRHNIIEKPAKSNRRRSVVAALLLLLAFLTGFACLKFSNHRASKDELDIKEQHHGSRFVPAALDLKTTKEGDHYNSSRASAKRSSESFSIKDENTRVGLQRLPVTSDKEAAFEQKSDIPSKTTIIHHNGRDNSNPTFASEDYIRTTDALIKKAMNAIRAEYGQHAIGNKNASTTTTPPMFSWDKVDLEVEEDAPEAFQKRGNRGNGGWTSSRSWRGLILRLIQAMSTRSKFTVVLGGHSAAAGHGNHFHQSYLMQFHKVMAPVFEQLGVTLVSRNQAQGGLGTVHSSLGFSSIYGDDIDLCIWNAGMTENHKPEHIDLFFRQALMSEGKVPVVWSEGGKFDLLRMYHNMADADVGEFGLGLDGIPETFSEPQAEQLPWATRHLKCSEERRDLCKKPYKYCATCWIPRQDKITPIQKQYDPYKGQVSWHPGWRSHQLTGRVLAFAILQALKDAIQMLERGDIDLNIARNLTSYYDNIRSKIKRLDPSFGLCYRIKGTLPARICRIPMKGRTQYTPRTNPDQSSITSIIKPDPIDGYVPKNPRKPLYDAPDAHNPCFDLPEGAVDVVSIIQGNCTDQRTLKFSKETTFLGKANQSNKRQSEISLIDTGSLINSSNTEELLIPGRGWQVFGEPQGYCDGSYQNICGKSTLNRCVLSGHHDERAAVIGSEMAGWLVLQIPREQVREGIIIVKLHTWHAPQDNSRTRRWKAINNIPQNGTTKYNEASGKRHLDEIGYPPGRRKLHDRAYKTPELPSSFGFEYAIDKKVTSLNRTEFLNRKQDIQRVVETLTLLDDQSFFGSDAENHGAGLFVEVALRLKGCFHRCVFGVSHLYWA